MLDSCPRMTFGDWARDGDEEARGSKVELDSLPIVLDRLCIGLMDIPWILL